MNTRPLPPPSIRWPVPGEIITHGKNAYAVGEALGRGTYGATFACTDQWNNNLVVKVLVPHRQTYEQVRVNWQREIASLFTLRHPNITYVHDAFERDATFHIVVERCGGSIDEIVRGVPCQTAEQLPRPFGPAIGQALRRHVHTRPMTAFEFWRRLAAASGVREEG